VRLAQVLGAVAGAVGPRGTFAVIGAVARNAWAPPRATTDIDLTVVADPVLLKALGVSLGALGYRPVREQRADPAEALPDIVIYRCGEGEPRQVDILVAKTLFEDEVLRRAQPVEIGSVDVPIASPEDLIVYKLLADRPRDREDIRAVLRTQARAARPLDWPYVERWVSFWRIEDRLRRLRSDLGD
jgi:hypothetical protein